jgi:hypothetical protein
MFKVEIQNKNRGLILKHDHASRSRCPDDWNVLNGWNGLQGRSRLAVALY